MSFYDQPGQGQPTPAPQPEPPRPQPEEAPKRKRFARFRGFCHKHNFSPRSMTLLLIVSLLLATAAIGFGIRPFFSITTKTTALGLRNIGEFATQAGFFTNVQVISGSRQLFGVTIPFTQSRYIYSYDGVIKAGYDFSEINVEVNELTHTVTVTLPEVKILSTEIDESSLVVYDEQDNIFTPLKVSNMNQSLVAMKEAAQQTAIRNGLYESARTNAETLIISFLSPSYDPQLYAYEFKPSVKEAKP